MEFIGSNRILDDCVIVAIHNALVAAGKPSTYDDIRQVSIRKGWYRQGQGFKCNHLPQAFKKFGLKVKIVPTDTTTKHFFTSVVNDKKGYLMLCPCPYGIGIGHAMVATRGERGVKVINSIWSGSGWKTLSKDIKRGTVKIFALEFSRSA